MRTAIVLSLLCIVALHSVDSSSPLSSWGTYPCQLTISGNSGSSLLLNPGGSSNDFNSQLLRNGGGGIGYKEGESGESKDDVEGDVRLHDGGSGTNGKERSIASQGVSIASAFSTCNCDGVAFPNIWSQLTDNIYMIDVHGCEFSGQILDNIGSTSKLTSLNLSGNSFSGTIPSSFATSYGITSLDLSYNSFYGNLSNIPSTLSYLDVSHNNFSGFIQSLVVYHASLYYDVSNNGLSGDISSINFNTFFNPYTKFSTFNIANNTLTGTVSNLLNQLGVLSNGIFAIGGNLFYGGLPQSIPSMINSNGLNGNGLPQLACINYYTNSASGDKITSTMPNWCRQMGTLCYCPGVCGDDIVGVDEVCEPSQGECCINCSSYAQAGTSCGNQNATTCSSWQCSGNSSICNIVFSDTTVLCSNSSGPCQQASFCAGNSSVCPPNVLLSNVSCRPARGGCDIEEFCDGTSSDCTTDKFQPAGFVCRNATDLCDAVETCDGNSTACPNDQPLPPGYVCRDATDLCDTVERCNGTSKACPADQYQSNGYVCRAATDLCDAVETCNGSSKACPADQYQSNGYVCRAAQGPCDITERCNGSSAACPADALHNGWVCRPANGSCDVSEKCDGNSTACPVDSFQPSGVVCNPSMGDCDIAEKCTGTSPGCPENAFVPSDVICRPINGSCDVAENCTGNTTDCPPDGFSTSICSPQVGECIPEQWCNGSSADCPVPVPHCDRGECNTTSGACFGFCGDKFCNIQSTSDPTFESCANCPDDCPSPCGLCGDGSCDASLGEDCISCFADCFMLCNNSCEMGCVHGICRNGLCECLEGYFGPTCNNASRPADGFNVTGPKITATLQSQVFAFLVLSVVEYGPNMEILEFVNITSIEFDLEYDNSSTSQFWNFSKVLDTGATIQIYITYFNSSTNVTFGDQTFYMAPDTFKLSVNIANWRFASAQNVLRVWFENSATGDEPLSSCNVASNPDSENNLRWLKLNLGGVASYAQMVDYAILDGTKRYITYETSNTTYAAVLPFFWYDAQLDPNFGFLVDGGNECDRASLVDSLRTRWEVYLAIPIGVVLIVGAVVLARYFRIVEWFKKGGNQAVEIDMDED